MGRRPKQDPNRVQYTVTTHIDAAKYSQLNDMLRRRPRTTMSGLIRDILENRPIKVLFHDETQDQWMDELSRLREEIRAIGININQITKQFNTYPEPIRKAIFAKIAFEKYEALQPHVQEILGIMQKLTVKWLLK